MEHGTISIPHEGSSTTSSGSPESINGLKFGHKIYFQEVGIDQNGTTCKPTSSNNSKNNNGITSKKGHIPRCQVEGCNLDLSDAKAYYSRHKVCAFHSKSPMVIVSGLEQRFCQQCSRFHQLPEFDQGKRSCRRRLAGHNERRRKPPPGSLLSSRLGRLSSSFFGDGTGRSGGILLDFSSYPSNPGKELWPDTKPSEQVPGNQSTSAGRYLHNIWPGNSEDPPQSKMFLPGSAGGSGFTFPSGECITGVSSDSSCALSLLSNQTWSSRNSASNNELGNLMNADGASISHCTGAHDVTVAHVSLPGNNNNSSWDFKDNDANARYQAMQPDHLRHGHMSEPVGGDQFHGDLLIEHIHSGGRRYMEVDHSRTYNSNTTENAHWSLF